jgi:hypothetical protein
MLEDHMLLARTVQQAKEKLRAGELYQDHGLVVCSTIGTPLLARNLDRAWYSLLKKSGFQRFASTIYATRTLLSC